MSDLDQGKIPEDLKEVVHRLASDAEAMDLRLAEYKFVHSSRMVGVAVGGAVFMIGILFVLVSLFLIANVFNINLQQNVRIAIGSLSGVLGSVQLLAGVLLIGR